ncbi:MAG TPA: tRNA (adenosine(37)-N6)-dimethylallyltransferase MiaA [Steroidobacter sp.]|nr:tRNA (adenosine(37)-N6)-dimethylallyltransferase MiaA [Steroidobacter sp.]
MSASAASSHTSAVLIMGPTGAGKTDLAIRLADQLPVEIVSVDSAMVYRGMDIGTGKPTPDVLRRYPHHLVDILDPAQSYSAGQFVRDAYRAIDEIRERGRLPLLVGGTMLYFRALRRGLAEMPQADADIRGAIDAEAAVRGWPAMHAELAAVDPRAAARIQPRDAQRIQRALEVYRLTGTPLSALHAAAKPPRADVSFVAYAWSPGDRLQLHQAIERRFHRMMEEGLLDEVRRLYNRGDLHAALPAIRSVGYRQLWEHLQSEESLDSAVQRAIFATRRLARRQLIWLRAEDELQWVDALEPDATALMERSIGAMVKR